jgi:hypothetical protein
VLIAFAVGGHALAAGTVSGLGSALGSLVFEVLIGFADTASSLAGFLGSSEGHVFGIAG